MDDVIAPAESRILVLQAMQHMGIGGHDPREAVLRQESRYCAGRDPGTWPHRPGGARGRRNRAPRRPARRNSMPAWRSRRTSAAQGALVAQIEGAVAQPQQDVGARHIGQQRQGRDRSPSRAGLPARVRRDCRPPSARPAPRPPCPAWHRAPASDSGADRRWHRHARSSSGIRARRRGRSCRPRSYRLCTPPRPSLPRRMIAPPLSAMRGGWGEPL